MKDEIIIINTFPNNNKKIELLKEQIINFKNVNYPILLISGCFIPKEVYEMVDYVIINKENDILDKKFNKIIYEYTLKNDIESSSHHYLDTESFHVAFYTQNMNYTITKNIKLSFNIAKNLGYKTALYTEDDNIFGKESKNFILKNMDSIKSKKYKLCGINTIEDQKYNIVYTTFFMSNINFLIDIFDLPSNIEEWYDEKNIQKYSLYKIYEGVFYDLLKDKIDNVKNITDEFFTLINNDHVKLNLITRYQNKKFTFDNFFNIIKSVDENDYRYKKDSLGNYLVLFNSRFDNFNVNVYFDDEIYKKFKLVKFNWHLCKLPENTKKVTFISEDLTKTIYITDKNIRYNGFFYYK